MGNNMKFTASALKKLRVWKKGTLLSVYDYI